MHVCEDKHCDENVSRPTSVGLPSHIAIGLMIHRLIHITYILRYSKKTFIIYSQHLLHQIVASFPKYKWINKTRNKLNTNFLKVGLKTCIYISIMKFLPNVCFINLLKEYEPLNGRQVYLKPKSTFCRTSKTLFFNFKETKEPPLHSTMPIPQTLVTSEV